MSDETPIPPLPEPETTKGEITFNFPSLLLAVSVDANGFVTKTIREGESRQVELTNVTTYYDEKQEPEQPFVIKALNRIQFGKVPVMVLSNAVPELSLPATSPSVNEYLALIGTEICVGFLVRRDNALSKVRWKDTYRTDRMTIVLQ